MSPGPRSLVLLHQGAGPTIDHFLAAPLERLACGRLDLDSRLAPADELARLPGPPRLLLVVRALPAPWLRPLRTLRRQGCRLIYVMDDDLLDPAAGTSLPEAYRRRLRQSITAQRRHVPELFDEVWVTSAALAAKYAHLAPQLLPLDPHPRLLLQRPRLQLAYLGTAAHQREFAWLLPLLTALQQRWDHTHVDLFGDLAINRQFRHLPRVRLLHPMDWERYLQETGSRRVDLLLCPLLEDPFNAGRAAVKIVDAARLGAVGLYSDREPYRDCVRHGETGLLLPDDPQPWLDTIAALIAEPERRQALAEAGRAMVESLGRRPGCPAHPLERVLVV